jgi:fumarylacetoacetate (FAA) hydrolase
MKLASLKAGGRDGALIVVSKDLTRAVTAQAVAPTLQAALDDWEALAPRLERLSRELNDGAAANAFPFDPQAAAAPLPRAYQWADGSAYLNHVSLVRQARGVEMPADFHHEPLLYQGGSDVMLGPCDPIAVENADWGIDFEAELAVITDDVPRAVPAATVGDHIKLVMLVNDVSLRNLILSELAKGFGFFQSKPPSAFSPVAVTPAELGAAWRGAKVCLPLLSFVNGKAFGRPDAGVDMAFDFARLIVHAARTRPLSAGTIVGSGTVSNRQADATGAALENGGLGHSCIAEARLMEKIEQGEPTTPFLAFGDRVRIEMLDEQKRSIFGAIDQVVTRA